MWGSLRLAPIKGKQCIHVVNVAMLSNTCLVNIVNLNRHSLILVFHTDICSLCICMCVCVFVCYQGSSYMYDHHFHFEIGA